MPLIEAIAQCYQNIKWETTVDKKKVGHKFHIQEYVLTNFML